MTTKKLEELSVLGLYITKLYLDSDKTEYFKAIDGHLYDVTREEIFN